ncbi:hypothetical protein [Paenibacillus sp. MBLB4367]|uniref:hypothetical protein n=1 Tax=Paenibacillus sp. MBLB4367 TaxID=3384767 RepID=UPI0039084309
MKKLLAAAVIVGVASIATAFAVNGSSEEKKAELPTPLIKFNGDQVIYADNFPDCH